MAVTSSCLTARLQEEGEAFSVYHDALVNDYGILFISKFMVILINEETKFLHLVLNGLVT